MQVLGACRADERLKPMLKLNISSGVAEDRLLVHLSQHFDASEVGMLARCLCVPLVSIRVGKVVKQGRLFCPIAARGHLNLTFLPSSDLRISFVGDDGCMERLAVLSPDDENAVATIEEIPADTSGRSFEIKLPGNSVFYFWLSEKSKLHGNQLLNKMKDLLKRKPSLAQLTGIRESRLNSFATYLRTSFINSTDTNPTSPANSSLTGPVSIDQCTTQTFSNPTLSSLKPSSRRLTIGQPSKTSPSQGTLSPRTNTFKEATPKMPLR
ncbi:hypothetical protein AMTR_s00029p00218570 [Amborella trichopoda]|uniref:Uncharacterized protein n=1 Tax=Amborella trichopoda TaxID=13333 RepID=W1PNS2_AMBTC|nr:hypothetical protein AMTR_s00029p00218570 [Amborella trichopoda]